MNNTILTALILITGVTNFVIAFYILFVVKRTKASTVFGIFCFEVACWNIINYINLIAQTPDIIILTIRLSIVPTLFMPATFLYFAFLFTHTHIAKKYLTFMTLPVIIMLVLVFTSWNVQGFAGIPSNDTFIPGPLYIIFSIYFILLTFVALYLLLQKAQKTTFQIERLQIHYIVVGFSVSAIVGLLTNAILPLFGIHNYNIYGIVASLIFTSLTTYTITRYRLFGARFLVRVLATRLITIIFLSALYISLFFLIRVLLASFQTADYLATIITTMAIVLSAKIFYQNCIVYVQKFGLWHKKNKSAHHSILASATTSPIFQSLQESAHPRQRRWLDE